MTQTGRKNRNILFRIHLLDDSIFLAYSKAKEIGVKTLGTQRKSYFSNGRQAIGDVERHETIIMTSFFLFNFNFAVSSILGS